MAGISRLIAALPLLYPVALQADSHPLGGSGERMREPMTECRQDVVLQPRDRGAGCADKRAATPQTPLPFVVVEPSTHPEIKQITVDSHAFFDFDQVRLKPSAVKKLDAVMAALQGYGDLLAVRIIGNADRIGAREYNRRLARERAMAVRGYLVDQGIPPDAVSLVSMGEFAPLVQCERQRGQALIDCLAPNRRVDLEVQAKEIP